MLSEFARVFERKVWRVQVAHLHNAARALSSPSRWVFSIHRKRKKMATGTFTYNPLRTKTLKERKKNARKDCRSFKLNKSSAVSMRMTAVKPYLPICPVGLVWSARYCGKIYSRHLFSYGGLSTNLVKDFFRYRLYYGDLNKSNVV